jgi:plasmid maintenance system killer protein
VLFNLKIKILILFLISTNASAGLRCDLLRRLESPNIVNNEKFWEDYTELASRNKLTDQTLEPLLKKHQALLDSSKEVVETKIQRTLNFSTSKKADKDLKKLSKDIRLKYEEFLSIMSDKAGIKILYANPGKWHMEKMKARKNVYTARLNDGVRVEFQLEGDMLEILQVNAADVHAF